MLAKEVCESYLANPFLKASASPQMRSDADIMGTLARAHASKNGLPMCLAGGPSDWTVRWGKVRKTVSPPSLGYICKGHIALQFWLTNGVCRNNAINGNLARAWHGRTQGMGRHKKCRLAEAAAVTQLSGQQDTARPVATMNTTAVRHPPHDTEEPTPDPATCATVPPRPPKPSETLKIPVQGLEPWSRG